MRLRMASRASYIRNFSSSDRVSASLAIESLSGQHEYETCSAVGIEHSYRNRCPDGQPGNWNGGDQLASLDPRRVDSVSNHNIGAVRYAFSEQDHLFGADLVLDLVESGLGSRQLNRHRRCRIQPAR